MRIEKIIIPLSVEEKLDIKHNVQIEEARYVLLHRPRIRFAEKGHHANENVYAAFGQTSGGRYLVIFLVYKPATHTAIIISARDMSSKERKQYGQK